MANRASTQSLSARQPIWICLTVIVTVFLVVTAASVIERITVARAVGKLSDHVAPLDELAVHQLLLIHSAQRVANIVQLSAAGIFAAVVIATIVLVHRLVRPLNTLVAEVRTVADGNYDQPISLAGPREIAELSEAVEEMRENLRASTVQLLDSERRSEQARIAADVHDRIIQRVFGLGLGLTSAAARRNPDLQPFIDETDEIIRDLREVIFNLSDFASSDRRVRLRSEVFAILERSAAALGFTPTLQFDGPVDDIEIEPALQCRCPRGHLGIAEQHREACTGHRRDTVYSGELK